MIPNVHIVSSSIVSFSGDEMIVSFDSIRTGDYIVPLGVFAADNAHWNGDDVYYGLLFHDTNGNPWYPEDVM